MSGKCTLFAGDFPFNSSAQKCGASVKVSTLMRWRNFVGEMLFGIQASQDVKLSNIARSLQEAIPLLKTEDCLSRNLQAQELETHLRQGLLRLGGRRVETHTVLCLNLNDVRKKYA